MTAFFTLFRRLLHRIQRQIDPAAKAVLPPEVETQIQQIAKEQQQPPEILLHHFLASAIRSADYKWQQWSSLTEREKCVAALGCLGYTNDQIARRLSISHNTVKTHIRHVLRKFGLRSKEELRLYLQDWDFSEFK